ncbi:MAG: efflux RND transporter periplasmic adaptor subunit [Pseudomonadota bacterium]
MMPSTLDLSIRRLAALVAVSAALSATVPEAAAQDGPTRVIVSPVIQQQIADTTPVIARLVGTRQAEVATRAAGIVESVEFETGDALVAGQPMVRMDRTLTQIAETNAVAALEAALAAVDVAEARARQSQQALERAGGLQGSTAFSRGTFEDLQQSAAEARASVTRAEAEVGIARAALARVRYDLEHMVLQAPFDGVVIDRMAQPGQYIDLGEAAARLLDVASLEIEADMPVDLMAGIRSGVVLDAVFDGGHQTTATIRSLLPVETTATRTRIVRLSVDSAALPLEVAATGRTVTLRVPISAPRDAPVIPKDALVQGRGGWSVYVADSGAAEPRGVRLGQSAGPNIEILSGLQVGEHVVVRGNERLRPGQPVAPVLQDGTQIPTGATAPEQGGEATSQVGKQSERADSDPTPSTLPVVPAGSAAAATRPDPATSGAAATAD